MVEEGHRKYLLRAITELKADVSRAVGQNVDLKEENQCLRCTIDDNKTRHERTMDRHRQARETSLKNVAAMRKRERELIDSESKLRSDTSSLRKENDDLRKKLNAQLDERSTLRRQIGPRFDFELIHRVDRGGGRVGGVADRYRRLFSIPPSLAEGLQGWGVKILCQGAGVLQIHCL